MPSFEILADVVTRPLYLIRLLKARQMLARLVKYQPVFEKKVPNILYISISSNNT